MPGDVQVHDLVKHYGPTPAVRGISFDVAGGEIFGLLGPNGAGKTTTIECILGLRHPDSGTITVAGIDARQHPQHVKQTIGASLQSTALQDKITPREALSLFGSFYQKPVPADQLIERFDLGEKADAAFDSLSGGQKQRLALALAFVNDPKLIFLDEPTAGLDPQSRRQLQAMITKLRDDGRTVLLTTHYIEEAEQLCDRIAIINGGKIVAQGKPDELIAAANAASHILVKTSRPLDRAALTALPAVVNVDERDGQWKIETSKATESTVALLRMLEAQGNDLVDLQIRRPSLEDVYLVQLNTPNSGMAV
jgi:ABC-2 type transport system ATP-binding protein